MAVQVDPKKAAAAGSADIFPELEVGIQADFRTEIASVPVLGMDCSVLVDKGDLFVAAYRGNLVVSSAVVAAAAAAAVREVVAVAQAVHQVRVVLQLQVVLDSQEAAVHMEIRTYQAAVAVPLHSLVEEVLVPSDFPGHRDSLG